MNYILYLSLLSILVFGMAMFESVDYCTELQTNARSFLPSDPNAEDCLMAYMEGCYITYSTEDEILVCQEQVAVILETGSNLWCPLLSDDSVTADELCECSFDLTYYQCEGCKSIMETVSDAVTLTTSDEDCVDALQAACSSLDNALGRQMCYLFIEKYEDSVSDYLCPMIRYGYGEYLCDCSPGLFNTNSPTPSCVYRDPVVEGLRCMTALSFDFGDLDEDEEEEEEDSQVQEEEEDQEEQEEEEEEEDTEEEYTPTDPTESEEEEEEEDDQEEEENNNIVRIAIGRRIYRERRMSLRTFRHGPIMMFRREEQSDGEEEEEEVVEEEEDVVEEEEQQEEEEEEESTISNRLYKACQRVMQSGQSYMSRSYSSCSEDICVESIQYGCEARNGKNIAVCSSSYFESVSQDTIDSLCSSFCNQQPETICLLTDLY